MCRLSEIFVVEAVEGGAKVLSHPVLKPQILDMACLTIK